MRLWIPALAAALALFPWNPAQALEPAPSKAVVPQPAPSKGVAPGPQPAADRAAPAAGVQDRPAVAPSPPAAEAAPESAGAVPAPDPGPVEKSDGTAPPAPPNEPPRRPRRLVPASEMTPEIVPARDTVGGHVAIGVHGGLFVPFGSAGSEAAQADLLGAGVAVGGDVTYGVSRTVMLGLYGEVGFPEAKGDFSGSDASSFSVGPLVRYHLVQGTRFDPWMAFGAGFRRTSIGSESLTGIDFARAELGGDWYATSGIGLGPLLQLSMGSFVDSSGANLGGKAVNWHFLLGGRVVLDLPGK